MNYHIINYKGLLRRGSRDLHQEHLIYGQGGLCVDYCGVGSAGESVRYFQFQSAEAHGAGALKIMFAKVAKFYS